MPNRAIATVIRRFTRYELTIRRLYIRDLEFRAACEDYGTAREALAVWATDSRRAADYRRLVGELEEEILGFLTVPATALNDRRKW